MRWITIPENIQLVNPGTDELAQEVSFSEYVRALRNDTRIFQGLGHLEAFELSSSLGRAKVGEAIPVEDASWAALTECAKAPKTLSPAFIFAPDAHRFVKAITEATARKPE